MVPVPKVIDILVHAQRHMYNFECHRNSDTSNRHLGSVAAAMLIAGLTLAPKVAAELPLLSAEGTHGDPPLGDIEYSS